MAFLQQTSGNNPTGTSVPIPVSGEVFSFKGNVTAGANQSTGWFETTSFDSLGFVFVSSKSGYYTLEYSNDETTLAVPMITVQYTEDEIGNRRKGAVDQDGKWCRITWYNNSSEQAQVYIRVTQKTGLFQPSLEVLSAKGAGTRLAQWVKSVLHIRDNNGEYGDIERTGNALNVNVINQSASVDTSPLAKEATLKDGSQKTHVTNFPAIQPISGAVSVSNFPATQQVSVSNFPATQPVSGSVSVSNFPNTQAISAASLPLPTGAATESLQTALNNMIGSLNAAQATNSTGSWSLLSLLKGILQRPSTGVTTSVNTTGSSSVILAANANRKGATVFSVSGTILVNLGGTASASLFTARLVTNGYFEVPFGYTGAISAIGSGTVSVTELT